uniref:Uncharacterized protein n=1 Tax=Loxodonta africana TaxID=9785 RepID=G3TV27_LOXAF
GDVCFSNAKRFKVSSIKIQAVLTVFLNQLHEPFASLSDALFLIIYRRCRL